MPVASKQQQPATPAPRTLPHNLEAERSVLGAILIENETFFKVAATLTEKHFFRAAHRQIFESMKKLVDKNEPIDLTTLKEELERIGELEEVGGPAYVASLVDGVPRSTNIVYYADIVKEKASLRDLIFAGNRVIGRAYEAEAPPKEILRWAEEELFDIRRHQIAGRMTAIGANLSKFTDDLDWRIANQGKVTGVTTGFHSIDLATSGLQPGEMTVVAARPSIGKTIFLMNVLEAMCRAGHRVAWFSLEMRIAALRWRFVSSVTGIPLTRLLGGAIGKLDWPKIADALELMGSLPMFIDDTAGRTVWDVRMASREIKAEGGLSVVAIDYAQLMTGSLERRGATRNEEITDISRRCKVLADELECHVILLSQLTRDSSKRVDPRPQLHDLRESGALEQDADNVGFLHRKHHLSSGTTEFILEKARMSNGGTLLLTIDRDIQRFTDGGVPEPEPAAEPEKPKKTRKPAMKSPASW